MQKPNRVQAVPIIIVGGLLLIILSYFFDNRKVPSTVPVSDVSTGTELIPKVPVMPRDDEDFPELADDAEWRTASEDGYISTHIMDKYAYKFLYPFSVRIPISFHLFYDDVVGSGEYQTKNRKYQISFDLLANKDNLNVQEFIAANSRGQVDKLDCSLQTTQGYKFCTFLTNWGNRKVKTAVVSREDVVYIFTYYFQSDDLSNKYFDEVENKIFRPFIDSIHFEPIKPYTKP